MENRKFKRVDFAGYASIILDDYVVWGKVNNLSLRGLYIKTSHYLPENKPVEVTIHHSSGSPIHLHATPVHSGDEGAGMKINQVDSVSFVYLKEVILSKCYDPGFGHNETCTV